MRTVLIFDSDRELGLGRALVEMLSTAGPLETETRLIPFTPDELPPPRSWGDFPAAFFLVLSPAVRALAPALLRSLQDQAVGVPVIAVFTKREPDEILALLDSGVNDFLVPPLRACEVLPRLWRLLGPTSPPPAAPGSEAAGLRHLHLVGASPSFAAVIEKLPLLAQSNATVLISGETGTGKELVARSIHYLSQRAKKPFVAVNCGAIPTDLVENELFGHERSAYSGANAAHTGIVHEAEGGTLLLDEIDCLPLLAQVKLLRLLQEKEYRPLGSVRACQADVRVLAAANGDLEEAVAAGRLRQDLYYRLNVIPLRLPPLRERRQDIPLLVRHFLDRFSRESRRPPARFAAAAMQRFIAHDWPGNVRELEHAVERAIVLTPPGEVVVDPRIGPPPATMASEGLKQAKARAVAQFEVSYIRGLLLANDGNISRAARAADKNRRAFWELIRKHRIDAQSFRHAQ
jgi:two-component system, NtrC family, response regulator GlrR